MSWKESFEKGIASFEANQLDKALEHFNMALAKGGDKQFTIYDSRSAVYEKLGKHKEALLDAEKAIDTAPERWQGYARAGRLFLKAHKPDSSITMIDMAIAQTKAEDAKRRVELENLKSQARAVRSAQETEVQKALQNHVSKLPVELLAKVFRIGVLEDLKSIISVIHVCKHWWDVAFDASELWDALVISDHNPTKKVKFWVERSKGRIRELCVKDSAWSYLSKEWKDLLKFIKWDRLRICRIQCWDIFQYLHFIGQTSVLDNLEELEIDDDKLPEQKLNRTNLIVPNSKIQRICLRSAFFKWKILGRFFNNLKYLEIDYPETEESSLRTLPDLIFHNLNLETVIIDSNRSYVIDFSFKNGEVHLHHLTRLEIRGMYLSTDFFENIMMPNLQVFKVWDSVEIQFPAIIYAHLSEIVIHNCGIAWPLENLINLVGGSSSLRTLELSQLGDAGARVLYSLLMHPESELPVFCPSLTHINVSGCPSIRTGLLVRLIKERLQADGTAMLQVSKIVSLNVDGCAGIDSDWIPWFRENLEFFSYHVYQ